MKLDYKLYKINDINSFAQYQELYDSSQKHIIGLNNLKESYEKAYEVLLPGVADDNTIAALLHIAGDGFVEEIHVKLATGQFLDTLKTTFGNENIFSYFFNISPDGQLDCYFFFIPLKKHVPNLDDWMDKYKKNEPSVKLIQKIEEEVSQYLPHLDSILQTKKLSDEELGYQPALLKYQMHKQLRSDVTPMLYTVVDNTSQMQTQAPIDVIKETINRIITDFTIGTERTTFSMFQEGSISEDLFIKQLNEYINKYFELTPNDYNYVMAKLRQWAFGMYILTPLIDDEEISDILVLDYNNIRVKVNGRRYTSNVKFLSPEDYSTFLYGLARREHLHLDRSAMHVFSDITTSSKFRMRMNIRTDFITSSGCSYFHIRKISKIKRSLDWLLDKKMFDEKIMNYLIDRARYSPGMVFTGKGASGKTTLMNALLDWIPFDKSVDVIQESEELFSDVHPHITFEHITNVEGRPEMTYNLQKLSRNGLLTDLDYFVIGEVKDAEAKYFLQAADTGHKCWCSVHAASAAEGIDSLANYVTYESHHNKTEALAALRNMGTVIFMKDFKVCEIAEATGWDPVAKNIIYTPIYLRPGMPHPAFEVGGPSKAAS